MRGTEITTSGSAKNKPLLHTREPASRRLSTRALSLHWGAHPKLTSQAYGHEGLLTWWQAAASNNATNRRATQATVSRTFFHIETSSTSKLDLLPATHVRSPRLSKCLQTATAATTLKSLLLLLSIPKRALVNGNFSNKCGTTSLS